MTFLVRRSSLIILLVVFGLLVQACGSAPPTATEAQPATTSTTASVTTTEAATQSEGAQGEAAAAATSEATAAAADTAQNLTPVKVVMRPFISFGPFYIAEEEGFFAEQGLDVEFVNMVVQRDMLPALASGQADVASGVLSAGTFNAIAQSDNIQIVADKGYSDPNGCASFALIARRPLVESGDAQDPEKLRGSTLSLVRASWLDYYVERALNELGLKVEDMQLTDIPSPTQQEALEQGTIDMVMNSEPWITLYGRAGHKPILTPAEKLLPDSQSTDTLYGQKLLGENADVGRRFMVAYLKGVRQYNQGKTDRNVDILARNIQLEPELLREMCWPTLRNDGQIDIPSTLDFQEWAQEKKFQDTVVPAEKFWNPSFIEYANEQLGAAR